MATKKKIQFLETEKMLIILVLIVWSLIWLLIFKIIKLNVKIREIIPNLLLGWLFSCFFLYIVGNADFIINSVSYWMVFTTVIIITVAVFTPFTNWGVLWTTSMLGSFYVALASTFIFKSNLVYAILNNIRRAFVPEYNYVNIRMHFGIPGMKFYFFHLPSLSFMEFLFIFFFIFRNLSRVFLVCFAYDEYCISVKSKIHSIKYR